MVSLINFLLFDSNLFYLLTHQTFLVFPLCKKKRQRVNKEKNKEKKFLSRPLSVVVIFCPSLPIVRLRELTFSGVSSLCSFIFEIL